MVILPDEEPTLIETVARVVAVENGTAWLEARPRSGCGGCADKNHCGLSVLGETAGKPTRRFAVADDFNARVGDPVVVGLPPAALLRASATVYGLPLLGLVLGAVAAGSLGTLGALAGTGLGFALGALAARQVSRQLAAGVVPIVLRRAPEAACPPLPTDSTVAPEKYQGGNPPA